MAVLNRYLLIITFNANELNSLITRNKVAELIETKQTKQDQIVCCLEEISFT